MTKPIARPQAEDQAKEGGGMSWLEDPDRFCDSCGTRVIDGRGVVHPCPICDEPRRAA